MKKSAFEDIECIASYKRIFQRKRLKIISISKPHSLIHFSMKFEREEILILTRKETASVFNVYKNFQPYKIMTAKAFSLNRNIKSSRL